jgi:hypothetical protein
MTSPSLEHLTTLTLQHNGDCGLLGVTPDFTIYVEEVYGEEGWLAQHALALDGSVSASVDESFGTVTQLAPLPLPDTLIEPQRGWHTMGLNFTGPRHRGLRGPERLDDLVHPFSVQEKFALAKQLKLDIMPPMLLGLAESYVLAEATVRAPHLFLVCRRLRIAYALPEERLDAEGEPYDYDTLVLHVAHFFDTAADHEIALSLLLADLQSMSLSRPMDCLITKDHLFIADGGSGERKSAVQIWHIDHVAPTLSDQEQLRKKLYG